MFSRLKKSIQKAGKSVEEGLERAGKNAKKNISEATDLRRTGSSPRKDSGATPNKAADKPKHSEKASTAAHTSEHDAAPLEERTAAASSAAPSVPRSRSATPERGPSTVAAHGDAEHVTQPPPPPARTPPRAAQTSAGDDEDDDGGVHSRSGSQHSAAASESIHFDQSDLGTAAGSILFTTDGASPERGSGGGAGQAAAAAASSSSPSPAKVKAEAAEGPAKQPPAAPPTAAAEVTSESSFDIQVEDDELDARAEAGAALEAEAKAAQPSEGDSAEERAAAAAPAKPASARAKKVDKAPAGSEKKESRSSRGAAVVVKDTASSRFRRETPTASRTEKTTSGTSKARGPTPPSRLSRADRGGTDALEPAKASSRASSASSAGRRVRSGSVKSAESSSGDERVPSRRRGRGFRATPTEDAFDEPRRHRSRSGGERDPRRSADVASSDDGDGRRAHRSRRTREATASSQSPVRHRTARHAAVGKLDGAALVQDCLREARQHDRKSAYDGVLPRDARAGRHTSSSNGGTSRQRRSAVDAMENGYNDELDEDARPRTRRPRAYADDESDAAAHERGTGRESWLHRYEVRGAASTSPGWRSRRAADTPPPLRGRPATSGALHRMSFYDDDDGRGGRDDDVYAAAAVHRPERFRALSERRRRHAAAGDAEDVEEAALLRERGAAYASGSRHSRRGSEVGPAPREHSRNGERRWQGEGEEDQWGSFAEHSRSVRRASLSRRESSVRDDRPPRREGSYRDPDYYFSDAPRRRFSIESDGAGGLWRSRSYRSPRRAPAAAAASSSFSAHGSPLRTRRGPAVVEVDTAQPRRYEQLSSPHLPSSPVRGRRAGSVTGTNPRTPVRRASQSRAPSAVSEREVLDEVEYKLETLEQEIADDDATREEAMRRSPFERLYHLNNRRDRDERRKKIFQLNRLERIRDRIVSGSLEEEIARREERLRKQEEMLTSPNGVFVRLYQNSSPHRAKHPSNADDSSARHGSPNTTGISSRPASTARSRLSKADTQALSNRLYEGAAATRARLDEVRKESAQERQRQEAEELLIARLAGQLQLNRTRDRASSRKPVPSPAALEAEARAELEQLRKDDPEGFEKKVLRGRVLSETERKAQATRMSKHGFISKEKLATRREAEELRGCTFQPTINEYAGFNRGGAASAHKRESRQSDDDAERDTRSSASTEPPPRRREVDKCQELYRKGMKARERGEELREERDRAMRLSILRSRMASDHHFRRRVELDPALAERFMKSIVV